MIVGLNARHCAGFYMQSLDSSKMNPTVEIEGKFKKKKEKEKIGNLLNWFLKFEIPNFLSHPLKLNLSRLSLKSLIALLDLFTNYIKSKPSSRSQKRTS